MIQQTNCFDHKFFSYSAVKKIVAYVYQAIYKEIPASMSDIENNIKYFFCQTVRKLRKPVRNVAKPARFERVLGCHFGSNAAGTPHGVIQTLFLLSGFLFCAKHRTRLAVLKIIPAPTKCPRKDCSPLVAKRGRLCSKDVLTFTTFVSERNL